MTSRSRLLVSAVVLASGVLTLMAMTGLRPGNHPPAQDSPSPEASSFSPGSAAMRATIDPETGKLTVGTKLGRLELDPATREAMRRDTEGLIEVHHPDGSVSVDLQGRFQSASVARIGKDGKVVICADDAAGAEKILDAPNLAPPTPREVQ